MQIKNEKNKEPSLSSGTDQSLLIIGSSAEGEEETFEMLCQQQNATARSKKSLRRPEKYFRSCEVRTGSARHNRRLGEQGESDRECSFRGITMKQSITERRLPSPASTERPRDN